MDYQRLQSGGRGNPARPGSLKKTDIQKAPLHINDVVDEVISLVQREMFNHQVSLRKELASGLPMVFVDRIQLQQVIINLVINSIEALQQVTDRPRELTIRSRRDGSHQVLVDQI